MDKSILDEVREGLAKKSMEEDTEVEEKKAVYLAPLLPTVLWAYRATPYSETGYYSPAM